MTDATGRNEKNVGAGFIPARAGVKPAPTNTPFGLRPFTVVRCFLLGTTDHRQRTPPDSGHTVDGIEFRFYFLPTIHPAVVSFQGHEFVVGAGLDDVSSLQYNDHVSVSYMA